MFVRLMLKLFGHSMTEAGECSFNIAGHGEVDFAFLVVPVKCNAKIPSSFPVFFDFVVLLKCLDEVVDVSFVNVFNAKIVHNQCEADGSPAVFFQYHGVTLLWRYPALSSRFSSNSWAMMPAWGSPCMPYQTLQWTFPVASTLLRKSYFWMMSSGNSSIFI